MIKFSYEPDETITVIIVLPYSNCYNRIPQTWWLKSNRNLFLVVLEAAKSKIKVLADSMSKESSILVHTPSALLKALPPNTTTLGIRF